MTRAGTILGTAAYMSPEQARGHQADRRSDIWSFSCVLYEMLAGCRPFGGDDAAETLAHVITKEPDWTALPAGTPASIVRLLRVGLEKDPRRRLPHIAIAPFEMDTSAVERSTETVPIEAPPGGLAHNARLAWGLFALAALAAVGLAASEYSRSGSRLEPASSLPALRSAIDLPSALSGDNPGVRFALSPDGRRLAFTAPAEDGHPLLWVRSLDGVTAQPLSGTDGAAAPFWSPDSLSIAFIADGSLKRIEAGSGSVTTLCQTSYTAPGTWNSEGAILFTPRANSGLFRVAATGGTPAPVTMLDEQAGETRHSYPVSLLDGRHFLFLVSGGGGSALGIDIGAVDSHERTRLVTGGSNTAFALGHLLFIQGDRLMAQAFDLERHVLSGEPVPLVEEIQADLNSRAGAFAASTTGLLVYQAGLRARTELVWLSRTGQQVGPGGEFGALGELTLSPDGRHASFGASDGNGSFDVWIRDLNRDVQTRFTFDPADEAYTVWSPDSRRIVFNSRRLGRLDLFEKLADGTGDEKLLLADAMDKFPYSWSPDGKWILYSGTSATTSNDLWLLPMTGDEKLHVFLQTSFSETNPRFSPDGRWVAYVSNRSRRNELYLTSFPDRMATQQVSTTGGSDPAWRSDGREIYFLSGNALMAAPVSLGETTAEIGDARMLFAATVDSRGRSYDVSADGQRFLVLRREEDARQTSLSLIANWPSLLTG